MQLAQTPLPSGTQGTGGVLFPHSSRFTQLTHILCLCIHNNRAIDNSGEASNVASVTLQVQDCDLIDIFQVPSTFPAFSGSYSYVHVSEDGPSLDNMKAPAHNVQRQSSGLNQFSLEMDVEP